MLTFAVNTLEQTLLEDQPAIVMKVAERRCRLKQLSKSAKKPTRRRQRSTDVLAVSGAALEGFKESWWQVENGYWHCKKLQTLLVEQLKERLKRTEICSLLRLINVVERLLAAERETSKCELKRYSTLRIVTGVLEKIALETLLIFT